MKTTRATGHCLCGSIRFEAEAEPISANICHCESCRRHGGGLAAQFVTFPKRAVSWRGAERVGYRSSPPVLRSFCGHCGSPLSYEHDQSPDEIDIYLGAVDDPGRFPVQMHVHYGERVAGFDTTDHVPRYRGSSRSGEPPVADAPAATSRPGLAIGQVPSIPRT